MRAAGALLVAVALAAADAAERRRVNWWFNVFDGATADHVVDVVQRHRSALTGVVQWVQPGGFSVHGDANWCPAGVPAPCAGHVDLPPHGAMVNATERLLELGLEVGVVFSFLPPAVFLAPGTPAVDTAVETLAATADKYNLTSLMVDFEGYSNTTGPNGTAIPAFNCSAQNADKLAQFLAQLASRLHSQGRRLGMSIEMGCVIGLRDWKRYTDAGVDYAMSMGSTYYGSNVSSNKEWVRRELSTMPNDRVAVGMGVNPGTSQACLDIMARGGSWGCPPWWNCPNAGKPNCTCPLGGPAGYNWTAESFVAFADWVGDSTPVAELDLYRGDMVRANADPILDCVPGFAYDAMERFLAADTRVPSQRQPQKNDDAPAPTKDTLFKPNDADADGVCLAGMRLYNKSFVGGCPCWRIPSILVAHNRQQNRDEILVFAEGRWFLGDGCEPQGVTAAGFNSTGAFAGVKWTAPRAIFMRKSTSGGESFGPIRHVIGNNSLPTYAQNPTPVFLAESQEILLMFACGNAPGSGVFAPWSCGGSRLGQTLLTRSRTFGASWSQPTLINRDMGPLYGGAVPGPAAGLRLRKGAYAGTLFFAGGMGFPRQTDVGWFSSDNGSSFSVSKLVASNGSESGYFMGFDEPAFAELSDGRIYLSLRKDSSPVRGAATSSDGGRSFAYVAGSGTRVGGLVRPDPSGGVQQPTITAANGTLFNAMPTQPGARANMQVFASDTDGRTWRLARSVYGGPAAYSSLAQRSDGAVVLAYERDVRGCAGESCSIQWTAL